MKETKQEPESAKESKLEVKQGESHDSLNSSDPDEEGSNEGEDYDWRERKDWAFDKLYYNKLRNLSTHAECSQAVDPDDIIKMIKSMKPKLEVGLEATKQRLGTDGATETQLEGARQELEVAEAQLEETRQELAATRGAKLSS